VYLLAAPVTGCAVGCSLSLHKFIVSGETQKEISGKGGLQKHSLNPETLHFEELYKLFSLLILFGVRSTE
jgi:hypothetical protein